MKLRILLIFFFFSIILADNTVTIHTKKEEVKNKDFQAVFYQPSSWLTSRFHYGNLSKQTINYDLAKELRKSGIGVLHFRVGLDLAKHYASPGFVEERAACDSLFLRPLGFEDLSDVEYGDFLCGFSTSLVFAESLGAKVNLCHGVQENPFENRSPFPDTVCTYYNEELDSNFYYYQVEVDSVIKEYMKLFHYLFGDPDADGIEGKWATLRADSCAECSIDDSMLYCGHNHPEPFDIVKYISFGNDGFNFIHPGNRDTNIVFVDVELRTYDGVDTYLISIPVYRDTISDSINYLESVPIEPHPTEILYEDEIYFPDDDLNSASTCYFHRRAHTFCRWFRMLHDSVTKCYPEVDLKFGPTFLYVKNSRTDWSPSRATERLKDDKVITNHIVFPMGNTLSPIDNEPYADYYNTNTYSTAPYGYMASNERNDLTETMRVNGDSCNCGTSDYLVDDDVSSTNMEERLLEWWQVGYYGINSQNLLTNQPGATFKYLRDSLGVNQPWAFHEIDVRTDDQDQHTWDAGQCGIPFNNTLFSGLALSEMFRGMIAKFDQDDDFPDIEFITPFLLHMNGPDYRMTCGAGDSIGWYQAESGDSCFTNLGSCNCDSFIRQANFDSLDGSHFVYGWQRSDAVYNPAHTAWKNGTPLIKQVTYYVYKMWNDHFGKYLLNFNSDVEAISLSYRSNLNNYMHFDDFFDIYDEEDPSDINQDTTTYEIVTVNPSRKTDGTISIMLTNKNIENPETLAIAIDDIDASIDSVRAWTLTGHFAAWDTHMVSLGRRIREYHGDDPDDTEFGWAHHAFINNGWPNYIAHRPYQSFVYIDSNMTSTSTTKMYEISSSDTTYSYEAGFSVDETLYVVLPKMALTAIELYPSIDTFYCVLDSGWNLISVPVYTGDTELGDIFAASSDEFWVDTTIITYSHLESGDLPDGAAVIPNSTDTLIDTTYYISRYNPYAKRPTAYDYIIDAALPNYYHYSSYTDSTNSPGLGFWVYSDEVDSVDLIGVPIKSFALPVKGNSVNNTGSVMANNVPLADNYDPEDFITPMWQFNTIEGGYDEAINMTPGKGFCALSRSDMTPDSCLRSAQVGETIWSFAVDSFSHVFQNQCSPAIDKRGNVYFCEHRECSNSICVSSGTPAVQNVLYAFEERPCI